MASGEEAKREEPDQGFAGLSSSISDVEDAIAEAKRISQSTATVTRASQSTSASQQTDGHEPRPQSQQKASQEAPGGSSAGKWILGIGAVIGVLWLLSSGSENRTPVSDAANKPQVQRPQFASVEQARPSSQPFEDKPPVGANHVLGPPQLRYCLSEEIRLQAAEGVVNTYVEWQVDRFNAMINDYNSRCGQFRYRRGSLERARAEVEQNRRALEADGSSRFSRGLSAGRQ